MRLTGLASGLDVDSMVKEMMKARRATAEKLFQKRTTLEWQQENYRELSTKIVDFRNNKLAAYSMSTAINAKTAEISGNKDALTLSGVGSTAAGTLSVTVNQVAEAAYTVFTFDPDNNNGTVVNPTTSLKLNPDLGFAVDGSGNGSLTVNGQTIAYKATDTIADLAAKINANKDAKATATYNEATGQFSIANKETGSGTVSITGFSPRFDKVEYSGKTAKATVNGVAYEQNSNRFSVSGIDFTVKQASGAGGATTLTTVTDTNKIIDTIKSFITDYNNLIGQINTELGEKRYRTYSPLTDEQKEAMSDKQVELWENRAKSGLLRNDSILSNLASNLRMSTTAEYATQFSISSIGIETGTWDSKGKLVLKDEAKLRAAIEADPQKVVDLFTKPKASKITSPNEAGVGIFRKLEQYTLEALKEFSTKAGTSTVSTDLNGDFLENSLISGQIRDIKRRENDLASRLADMENRYYKQFAAMEEAINKFNQQASAFSSFGR